MFEGTMLFTKMIIFFGQVIHYELPNTTELFVHRSGRTGRAGKKGSAILIHSYDQNRLVRGIEQEIGCRFIEVILFFLFGQTS